MDMTPFYGLRKIIHWHTARVVEVAERMAEESGYHCVPLAFFKSCKI